MTERPSLTEDLARRVAAILETADGGCRWCQVEIAKRAGREFPEFDWFALIAGAGEFPVEELHEIDWGDT